MTPDDLASAFIDGDLEPEERRRIEASPELWSRVQELSAVAHAVSSLIDGEEGERPSAVARSRHIGGALDEFDRLNPSPTPNFNPNLPRIYPTRPILFTFIPNNVRAIRHWITQSNPALIAVASAVIVVVAFAGLVGIKPKSSDGFDTAASVGEETESDDDSGDEAADTADATAEAAESDTEDASASDAASLFGGDDDAADTAADGNGDQSASLEMDQLADQPGRDGAEGTQSSTGPGKAGVERAIEAARIRLETLPPPAVVQDLLSETRFGKEHSVCATQARDAGGQLVRNIVEFIPLQVGAQVAELLVIPGDPEQGLVVGISTCTMLQ